MEPQTPIGLAHFIGQTDAVVTTPPEAEPDARDDAQHEDVVPAAATSADPSGSATDGTAEPDVLPRGNPLRVRSAALIAAGVIPAFLLMAKNAQHWWGVPAGLLFVAIAAWGVMDLLGAFDDGEEHVTTRSTLSEIAPSLGLAALAFVAFCAAIALGQASIGPWWVGSVSVTASFLALVASVFRLGTRLGPWQLDELGVERPLLHRPVF